MLSTNQPPVEPGQLSASQEEWLKADRELDRQKSCPVAFQARIDVIDRRERQIRNYMGEYQ